MGDEDVFNRIFPLACHRCECPDFRGEQSTANSDSNGSSISRLGLSKSLPFIGPKDTG